MKGRHTCLRPGYYFDLPKFPAQLTLYPDVSYGSRLMSIDEDTRSCSYFWPAQNAVDYRQVGNAICPPVTQAIGWRFMIDCFGRTSKEVGPIDGFVFIDS
jgi:hypothetical protein